MAPAHLWIVDRPIQPCDRRLRASPVPGGLPVVPAWHLRVAPRLHPPAHPAAHLNQVALAPRLPWGPDCSGAVRSSAVPAMCRRVASLPHPSALPAPEPQVAPLPGHSSLASPWFRAGYPGFYTFRLFRRWRFGLPRAFHPSARPFGDSAGCPASSLVQLRLPVLPPSRPGFRTLRLCQRWSARVAPCPRILRRCRRWRLRVAPPLRSSSLASRRFHRVAPAFTSSGAAEGFVFGLPRILLPSALPLLRPSGCPLVLHRRLGR